jgi:N-dimethylarginine dimethylaminohydrolase
VNTTEISQLTPQSQAQLGSIELVVRAPTAFEISTADNVYMEQEIRSRIEHIKTHLTHNKTLHSELKANQLDLSLLEGELDSFLSPQDHRTWLALAQDVVEHISTLPAAIQRTVHHTVMAEVLAHRQEACQQHENLIKAYEAAGIKVTRLPDHPGSDAVFATDTGEQIQESFLLGSLKNPRRHGEERCTVALLAQRKIPVRQLPGLTIEGGDLIYSPIYETLFVGEGFRNTDHPTKDISQAFPKIRVLPVGLVKAEHYHLDCCFMVLSQGEILVYKDAIDANAFDAICQLAQANHKPAPFLIQQQEALSFGTNLVCVGKNIFHAENSLSEKTLTQLADWGYQCHSIQYDALHRSGGSIRCSTLAIRSLTK